MCLRDRVKEATNFSLLVDADAALFKMADACHFGVEGDFGFFGESAINRMFRILRWPRGVFQRFRMGDNSGRGHGSADLGL